VKRFGVVLLANSSQLQAEHYNQNNPHVNAVKKIFFLLANSENSTLCFSKFLIFRGLLFWVGRFLGDALQFE
jgi:hypothetical protein